MKKPQDINKQMGVAQESMLKMHKRMHLRMDAKNPQQSGEKHKTGAQGAK